MKNFTLLFTALLLSLFTLAQAPQAFKFQTVIRDGDGEVLPLQDVTLKFLLRADAPDGEVAYAEQHYITTNALGLVSLNIGSGEVVSGDFANLEWGDHQYFLEELIDVGNTANFVLFGTVQLLSVPYALHANTAGNGIQSMSEEERDTIESPAVGMQIYNTTTNCLNYWSGSNWFETCGDCTPQPSNANAGTDQTYFDSTTVHTLDGNIPEEGTGLWTKATSYPGWFEDPNDPTTTFHGEPCRSYYLKWIISTSCGSDYDYVKITFDDTPSDAYAGQDTVINTEILSINLSAVQAENGTGEWNIISGEGGSFLDDNDPNTEFTGLDCIDYELSWTVATECHQYTDTVSVGFYAIPTQANAGQDMTINNETLSIDLDANTPQVGVGTWSIISGEGGEIDDANNPNAVFTALPCETYELIWTIATACEASSDTLKLDFFTIPTQADAGEDQFGLDGTWTTLEANEPELGEGQWTILSGEGGQITNPNSPASVFLGQNMISYVLEWQIATLCDTARDEVNIAFGFIPISGCGDSLVDERDGQKYATVQIGEQCWMAENLNIGEQIDGNVEMTDNGILEKYCPADGPQNCETYGGLYQWNEMMQYLNIEENQGVCPEGWVLPSDEDWCTLEQEVDSTIDCNSINSFRGIDGGTKLKQGGSSGFEASLSGTIANGIFSGLNGFGYYWTSTIYTGNDILYRMFIVNNPQVHRDFSPNSNGYSVRCLKSDFISTNQPPNQPSNPNPENGSINISIDTTLSWSCNDPDGDPLTYDVYFGTEDTPPQVATAITDTFYTPATLEYATTYYWKIVAHDDQENFTEGEVWSFTTEEELELTIGDEYQGGIIAYILQPGDPGYVEGEKHGIIAASSNQSPNAPWGCIGTSIPGADGTALGTGYQNTLDIIAGCVTAGIAAQICNDLELNGYTDWYLPSKDELNKLYLSKDLVGGFAPTYYWSSSESESTAAVLQDFSVGSQLIVSKEYQPYVRAVRAFTATTFTCGDAFTDTRDGQTYETVKIGEQCWMAENLNVGERIDGIGGMTDSGILEKYCYDDDPANCEVYGGLYQWNEMMQYVTAEGMQGICPIEWHLPSDEEWKELEGEVDSQFNYPDPEWDGEGLRGLDAGKNLKSNSGWNNNGNGTDLYGFGALPGGSRNSNGSFSGSGNGGSWCSSSEQSITDAWNRYLYYDHDVPHRNYNYKTDGFSVRCLMDEDQSNLPPSQPVNPNPENGAVNQMIIGDLSWSCTDPENDPLTYDVYFGTEPTPPQVTTGIPDTFYTPATLEYATTYYWKIVAHDDQVNSTEGEVWSFTTVEESEWQCGDTLIDNRDGQNYATVQIGEQCWMAKNLNVGIRIDGGEEMMDNGIIEKYCYEINPSNCETYGGLYLWNEMMQYVSDVLVVGVCPIDWHIPLDEEWKILEGTVDSQLPVDDPEWDNVGNRGFDVGINLKSISGWSENGNDAYNFNAKSGGFVTAYGDFHGLGATGYWWTLNEYSGINAWGRGLFNDSDGSNRWDHLKTSAFSVRCIKN